MYLKLCLFALKKSPLILTVFGCNEFKDGLLRIYTGIILSNGFRNINADIKMHRHKNIHNFSATFLH